MGKFFGIENGEKDESLNASVAASLNQIDLAVPVNLHHRLRGAGGGGINDGIHSLQGRGEGFRLGEVAPHQFYPPLSQESGPLSASHHAPDFVPLIQGPASNLPAQSASSANDQYFHEKNDTKV
jgi:hypothetical protein